MIEGSQPRRFTSILKPTHPSCIGRDHVGRNLNNSEKPVHPWTFEQTANDEDIRATAEFNWQEKNTIAL